MPSSESSDDDESEDDIDDDEEEEYINRLHARLIVRRALNECSLGLHDEGGKMGSGGLTYS